MGEIANDILQFVFTFLFFSFVLFFEESSVFYPQIDLLSAIGSPLKEPQKIYQPLYLKFFMTISVDVVDFAGEGRELTQEQIQKALPQLRSQIINESGKHPLHERFRAIFTLKSIGTDEAIQILGEGFSDQSALLKHELAYVLGQTGNLTAIPILVGILNDLQQDPMVRHEAGEALGAIGNPSVLPTLKLHLNDTQRVVRETCELAIAKINLERENPTEIPTGVHKNEISFESVDPAPAMLQLLGVEELKNRLMDTSLPLFDRYRAMFSLRNKATNEAVLAICEGFKDDSALFRHEIAYVLGQLQNSVSVPALQAVLEDMNEIDMVRHECAEAIGSIATPECFPILERFVADESQAVRESCIVALDIFKYENSNEFQYADGIQKSE